PAPPAPGVGSIVPLSGPVAFHGRGAGHGVGLSQWGARGRALAGQTAAEILGHYYPGTVVGSVDPRLPVRVLVLSGHRGTAAAPLTLFGRGGAWTIDGSDVLLPPDARLTLVRSTLGVVAPGSPVAWQLTVRAVTGEPLLDRTVSSELRLRPAGPTTRLQVWSKPSVYDLYRGDLRIVLGSTASVVNELTLDVYLRGVVPAEMPATWPLEALRAQAIVARSYAARRVRSGIGLYDLTDDTRTQVYRGVRAERPATTRAILDTTGLVVRDAQGAIANTLFHAAAAGATESNESVFVASNGARLARPVAYLRSRPDRAADGTPWDDLAGSPWSSWRTATYAPEALSAILAADPRTNVGLVLGLGLSDRGASGRLASVTIVGTAGTRTLAATTFQAIFNARRPLGDPPLRSTWFDLGPIP
ncbi:MAG TPA: SpoIID/LytB domain-containing protein, partial [Candidatus Limnocylindrales bacterium]|nr:SpoIID/LytB domain-containing protein [Candidatus Limnocylindrales bacterium]